MDISQVKIKIDIILKEIPNNFSEYIIKSFFKKFKKI